MKSSSEMVSVVFGFSVGVPSYTFAFFKSIATTKKLDILSVCFFLIIETVIEKLRAKIQCFDCQNKF